MIHTAEVKKRVDAEYKQYLNHAVTAGDTEVMCRLVFQKQVCLEMYEESDEQTKENVLRRMKNDTLRMPEDLQEVEGMLGEEEARQYFQNYRRQG